MAPMPARLADKVSGLAAGGSGRGGTKTAINSIKAMQAEAGISAVEQPVEGIDAMARVSREVDIPVFVDEGCWTPEDTIEIVQVETGKGI